MMAYLFEQNLLEGLEAMKGWDLDVYRQRQLPNFLIVKFASAFKKPIDSKFFYGTISMNHYSVRSQMIMARTSCAFHDDQGGWAEGEVTIAILNGDTEKANVRHREPALVS
jgi:hypothetical protein